jgi:hypothetical protein
MQDHTPENWKPIAGTDGKYEVSDLGRVRSYARKTPRFLSAANHGAGYRSVRVVYDGAARTRMVHHLVLAAFVGPRPTPDHETRHKNNRRSDNRAENLAWATKAENMWDKVASGGAMGGKGKCLSLSQVCEIRLMCADGLGLKAVAEKFDVQPITIWQIKTRRTWAALDERVVVDHVRLPALAH